MSMMHARPLGGQIPEACRRRWGFLLITQEGPKRGSNWQMLPRDGEKNDRFILVELGVGVREGAL